MEFALQREALLKPLQTISNVVERRQTMPVLGNVLMVVKDGKLHMTTTDTEIELKTSIDLPEGTVEGSTTLPARKCVDICRSLPDDASVAFKVENERGLLRSGKSRFTLSCLPAQSFPNIESDLTDASVTLSQSALLMLLRRTAFAMAQQDVRFFLNGVLLEIYPDKVQMVATDGHRLALGALASENTGAAEQQLIIPRKAVSELIRLLSDTEDPVTLQFGQHHIRAEIGACTFTSKLLDGRYPDYNRVIPAAGKNVFKVSRDAFRQGLQSAAILSNEQYRGVNLTLTKSTLQLTATNPQQEEAKNEIEVDYVGDDMTIGFNVNYLLDIMGVLNAGEVTVSFEDSNSSALIQESENPNFTYVVMPIRL